MHIQGTPEFKNTAIPQYADFSYLYSGVKYCQINYLDWAVWMQGISFCLCSHMCYSDNIVSLAFQTLAFWAMIVQTQKQDR